MSLKIIFEQYGSPQVLRRVDEFLAEPEDGQVRIANRVISVNPVDWKLVAGHLKERRPVEFPAVPGNESSGVVEAVGANVNGFAVGDEVIWYGFANGYRAKANVEAASLIVKPAGIDFEQAASLPVAGGTAYSAVQQVRVGADDTVLIHAGAGGVGSAAVQIARSAGARVIATASAANHGYLESIGAEPVRYGDGLAERVQALGSVTASIDTFGDAMSVAATVQLLPDLSRAVTVVTNEHSIGAGIASVLHAPERLTAAVGLAEAGKLRLAIAARLPLADAAQAFEVSYAGHLRGKIILIP